MSLDIKVMPLGPISANCYILTDKKSRESAVIDPGDFEIDEYLQLLSDAAENIK